MEHTRCGNICEQCALRAQLDCPGCRAGPGSDDSCDCELAKCCRDMDCQDCAACRFHPTCLLLAEREQLPADRLRRRAEEADRRAARERQAPVLGRWLRALFWLIVPDALAALLTLEPVALRFPPAARAGHLLSWLCDAASILILFRLGAVADHYRLAGWCQLLGLPLAILSALFLDSPAAGGWKLIASSLSLVIGMAGTYQRFMGHRDILWGVDNALAGRWDALWRWFAIGIAAILADMLLVLVLHLLGMLILLAALLELLVIGILELIALYRTARCFPGAPV